MAAVAQARDRPEAAPVLLRVTREDAALIEVNEVCLGSESWFRSRWCPDVLAAYLRDVGPAVEFHESPRRPVWQECVAQALLRRRSLIPDRLAGIRREGSDPGPGVDRSAARLGRRTGSEIRQLMSLVPRCR